MDSVELRQVFINVPAALNTVQRKHKKNMLEKISVRLKNGTSFDQIIQEVSHDDAYGRIGIVERGDLPPELEQVVFSLKTGEISPVVASNRGLHIFKVARHYPGKIPTYEQVKAQIQIILEADKLREFLRAQAPLLRQDLEIQRKSTTMSPEVVSKT
jgi:parvulin-like peptidyl-prolyl isomerase